MKKTLKITTVLLCSALVLCSCGKKDKSESSSDKNNMEISTTVPNDVYVVAPDVIQYDKDGNVIEPTATATDSQYIEINPFEGWDINQFVRKEDGKITYEWFSDWSNSYAKRTLTDNNLMCMIDLHMPDGTRCDPFDLPEGETIVAHIRKSYDDSAVTEKEVEEYLEYAKEHGILLTEMSREVVVKVTRDETEK